MHKTAFQIGIATIVVLASMSSAGYAQNQQCTSGPTFITFEVPNSTSTVPYAINPAGQIAGVYAVTVGNSSVFLGFLRQPDGTISTFDVAGAHGYVVPLGIDPAGEIVGYYTYGANDPFHGFLRQADGTVTTFDVPGSTSTSPAGINPAGEIVGYYTYRPNLEQHGFLRHADGTFTTFDVPGSSFTIPTAINPAGEIVGIYDDAAGTRNFLREADGTFVTIETPASDAGFYIAINTGGDIAGSYEDSTNHGHGFLRHANGGLTTIDVPDSTNTGALGINDAGQIIGTFNAPPMPFKTGSGFLREPDGTFRMLDNNGNSFEKFPTAINPAGEIVGWLGTQGFLVSFSKCPDMRGADHEKD
jgi:uncharacterized membrane protein